MDGVSILNKQKVSIFGSELVSSPVDIRSVFFHVLSLDKTENMTKLILIMEKICVNSIKYCKKTDEVSFLFKKIHILEYYTVVCYILRD